MWWGEVRQPQEFRILWFHSVGWSVVLQRHYVDGSYMAEAFSVWCGLFFLTPYRHGSCSDGDFMGRGLVVATSLFHSGVVVRVVELPTLMSQSNLVYFFISFFWLWSPRIVVCLYFFCYINEARTILCGSLRKATSFVSLIISFLHIENKAITFFNSLKLPWHDICKSWIPKISNIN